MKLMIMKWAEKATFFLLLVLVFGGIFSCKPNNNVSGLDVFNSENEERKIEAESIDIKAKLASGESFVLPSIAGCNYDVVEEALGVLVEHPSIRQQNQISEILKFSGLPSNFQILKTTNKIENAFAAIFQEQRLIVFDEKLLKDVEQGSSAYWSSMSILAHEIGHHLSGHTLDREGSNHQTEMEADRFSGFVLFKMGASLNEAMYAMDQIGSETDSRSHPSRDKRLEYIEEGWREAERQRAFAALPPAPYDDYGDDFKDFPPDVILDFDQYNDLYILGNRAYSLTENIEGIIIKSGDRDAYLYYDIFLTSLPEEDEYLKVGEIFTFGMSNPIDAYRTMHRMERDAFTKGVMVPGRKIKFTLNEEGNQRNYSITKVEVIPRD